MQEYLLVYDNSYEQYQYVIHINGEQLSCIIISHYGHSQLIQSRSGQARKHHTFVWFTLPHIHTNKRSWLVCLSTWAGLASVLSVRSSCAHTTCTRPARLPRNARFELLSRAWLEGSTISLGPNSTLDQVSKHRDPASREPGSLLCREPNGP